MRAILEIYYFTFSCFSQQKIHFFFLYNLNSVSVNNKVGNKCFIFIANQKWNGENNSAKKNYGNCVSYGEIFQKF